jgi:hypothetical protein
MYIRKTNNDKLIFLSVMPTRKIIGAFGIVQRRYLLIQSQLDLIIKVAENIF